MADKASLSKATKRQSSRFDELEAYRGIAALLIVVFHVYQYTRTGMGLQSYPYEGTPLHAFLFSLDVVVSWFFALSGFLIFLPFARAAYEQTQSYSTRGFLVRRAIRILPVYYVAIVVVWTWRFSDLPGQWTDLLEHLMLIQVLDNRYIFSTIGPAWSLAVEMQFYALAAALGFLMYHACSRLTSPRVRLIVLIGPALSLALASIAFKWWAYYVAHIPLTNFAVYFSSIAKLDTFAFGMLLAVALAAAGGRSLFRGALPTLLVMVGLALTALFFAFRLRSALVNLYVYTLCGVAFTLILAATILGPRGSIWERMLAREPLLFLGQVSYGIYLWQEPILLELGKHHLLIYPQPSAFLTNLIVLLVLSVAAGAWSYWGLERPMGRLRYLFTERGRLASRYLSPGT